MPNAEGWIATDIKNGMGVVSLSEWRYFDDYVNEKFLGAPTYIFRGQASHTWSLQSRFDRIISIMKGPESEAEWARDRQLLSFRKAVRGRRGTNPPNMSDDNDWWALGQHYGLATPLLDFTESPFVALYFAFVEELNFEVDYRAVWALLGHAVDIKSAYASAEHELDILENRPRGLDDMPRSIDDFRAIWQRKKVHPILKIVNPDSDENARLVSQRGLFVRVPDSMTLEDWVEENFKDENRFCVLIKILIPNREREKILISLNRKNINHLSLFPDLYGASKYCNTALKIPNY